MIMITLIASASILTGMVSADEGETDGPCAGEDFEIGSWGFVMAMMMLGMFCVFIFVILFLYHHGEPERDMVSQVNSVSVLDERYAKGEIARSEYLLMKEDLKR